MSGRRLRRLRQATAVAVLFAAGCGAPSGHSIAQTAAPEAAAQLRATVEREGAAGVIVTLAIAGAAPPSADEIRAAQERLLAALAGARYENLHLFRNVPQLSLTARRDALEALFASPLVASVVPDAMMGTMTPGTAR